MGKWKNKHSISDCTGVVVASFFVRKEALDQCGFMKCNKFVFNCRYNLPLVLLAFLTVILYLVFTLKYLLVTLTLKNLIPYLVLIAISLILFIGRKKYM